MSRLKGNRNSYLYSSLVIIWVLGLLSFACKPINDFHKELDYSVSDVPDILTPTLIDSLKTVILIADHRSTEIFDLLSPFYLFANSRKANVFIVAKDALPINLFRGLMVMPQHTFESFEDLGVKPDLIIIPNLSSVEKDQIDPIILDFIKSQYQEGKSTVLSVCDGAAVASQTGLFEGFEITTHSSDLDYLAKQWPNHEWKKGIKVTKFDNFYSTAGVSNATDGSLLVMASLFGSDVASYVADQVHFSSDRNSLEKSHQPLFWSDKYQILKKVFFHDNKNLGFMLTNGISEINLAGMLDTYSRTFPKSIGTFSLDGKPVISENGLLFIPTNTNIDFDEVHIFEKTVLLKNDNVKVHSSINEYVFDYSLSLVESEYGEKFKKAVIKLLDYEYKTN